MHIDIIGPIEIGIDNMVHDSVRIPYPITTTGR